MNPRERFLSECKRRLVDFDSGYLKTLGFKEVTVELVEDGRTEYVTISGPGYDTVNNMGYRGIETILNGLGQYNIRGSVIRKRW